MWITVTCCSDSMISICYSLSHFGLNADPLALTIVLFSHQDILSRLMNLKVMVEEELWSDKSHSLSFTLMVVYCINCSVLSTRQSCQWHYIWYSQSRAAMQDLYAISCSLIQKADKYYEVLVDFVMYYMVLTKPQ